jgi:hypothetical protein
MTTPHKIRYKRLIRSGFWTGQGAMMGAVEMEAMD